MAPRLLPEAGEVLRAFYLNLRRQSAVADGLPVTVRPLRTYNRRDRDMPTVALSA